MDIEEIISRWHTAVNAKDEELLAACVAGNVVLGGPKGEQQGRDEAIAWVHRSGIELAPVDWHSIDASTMVVEERAMWPDNDDPAVVFTRYEVGDGWIRSIRRFSDLHAALKG